MRPGHVDAVAEEGRCDCEPMCGGELQLHRRRRGGVYRGGGDFQVPGKDVGPVRQILDGGPSECWEGTPSMESYGETSKEGGGGSTSVRNVLLGSVPGSIDFWGGDLGFVGGDVLEAEGGAREFPKADNRKYVSAAEGYDLVICGSIEGP